MSTKSILTNILQAFIVLSLTGCILFFVMFHLSKDKVKSPNTQSTENIIKKESPDRVVQTEMEPPDISRKTHILPTEISQKSEQLKAITPTASPQLASPEREFDKKEPEDLPQKVIRYESVRDDTNHPDHELIDQRKKQFGLEKSLDLIVRPDENVLIGNKIAPIKEIAERLQLKQGKIIEKDIHGQAHNRLKKTQEEMKQKMGKRLSQKELAKRRLPELHKSQKNRRKSPETIGLELDQHSIIESDLYESIENTQKEKDQAKQKSNALNQQHNVPQSIPLELESPPSQLVHHTNPLKSPSTQSVHQKESLDKPTQSALHKKQKESDAETPKSPTINTDNQHRSIMIPGYSSIEGAYKDNNASFPAVSAEDKKRIQSVFKSDMSPDTRYDFYQPVNPKPGDTESFLGIRVVHPGTNIWDIHFDLLKEYFGYQGVTVSPHADEPQKSGKSSGVGKVLKFSEKLVNIYNLEKQAFEEDLNVIYPKTIIVIYNMTQIFGILDDIDYSIIDHIEFDGESLWIPAN